MFQTFFSVFFFTSYILLIFFICLYIFPYMPILLRYCGQFVLVPTLKKGGKAQNGSDSLNCGWKGEIETSKEFFLPKTPGAENPFYFCICRSGIKNGSGFSLYVQSYPDLDFVCRAIRIQPLCIELTVKMQRTPATE